MVAFFGREALDDEVGCVSVQVEAELFVNLGGELKVMREKGFVTSTPLLRS